MLSKRLSNAPSQRMHAAHVSGFPATRTRGGPRSQLRGCPDVPPMPAGVDPPTRTSSHDHDAPCVMASASAGLRVGSATMEPRLSTWVEALKATGWASLVLDAHNTLVWISEEFKGFLHEPDDER